MGFIFSKNTESPVFDIPQIDIYKTEFVDRRIATIVARSVLSEKNQPTKPSTDYKFRKCYSAYVSNLYKYEYRSQEPSKVTVNYRMLSKEEPDYCMPLAYYYHYRRLRQKSIFYLIDTKLPSGIFCPKTDYNEDFPEILFEEKFSYYSKCLKIGIHVPFKDTDNPFKFLIYEKYTKNIFVHENSIINKSKIAIGNLDCSSVSRALQGLENYLILTFLYDFTRFTSESREKMTELGLEANLKLIDSKKNINIKYDISGKQKLAFVSHCLEKFQPKVKEKVEEIYPLEFFAKFYLTAPKKLLPYENGVGINNEVIFSSGISTFIVNPRMKSWDFKNNVSSIPEKYAYAKNDKNISKMVLEHCSEFKHNINTDWFRILPFKHSILSGRKPISVLLRYRAPRLALKLSIFRPRFLNANLDYKIKYDKKLGSNILTKQTKTIKANFNRVVFNHKSPRSFKSNLKEEFLDLKNKFKQRKSSFLSKSPRHSRYSYKLLHKILSDFSFKKSKRIIISPNSYISQNNKLRKLKLAQIVYVYNFFKIECISFVQKPVKNRIDFKRSYISQIVYSDKDKIIKKVKEPINNQTERKRLGINYLKCLQTILLKGLNIKENYSLNYLKPRKRITPFREQKSIKKGLLSLLVLKNKDELFNRQTNALDSFIVRYKKEQYDYYPYLPKQVVDSFGLDLKIIGVKEVSALSQKNIVPPPGWKKVSKYYDCKIKLGPYPFGFPAFFIGAPIFNVLTTRGRYSIKDVLIDRLLGESLFILKKDKLYLPELSMKQPRRLLYTEITPKNSPKEYYRAKPEAKRLDQDQPTKISYFDYTWLLGNQMNFIGNKINSFFTNERIKIKHYFLGSIKYFNFLISFTSKYLPDSISASMPFIDNLCLKANLIKIRNIKGIIPENGFIKSFNKFFAIRKLDLAKPLYQTKNLLCSMNMPNEWTFSQDVKVTYPASEYVPQYITRFRSFHFPYIPEAPDEPIEKVSFGADIDYASLYNCKFQEDFRISQFDFGLMELQNDLDDENEYDAKLVGVVQNAFSVESDYIVTNAVNNYICPSNYNFKIFKFNTPDYYQHLITPRFFRIKENLSYKYKRRGKTIQNLKYISFAKLLPENYSNITSKTVESMDSPSFHWIILLRKNNSLKVSYNYYNLETYLNEKEISLGSFCFANFDKDNYLDYKYGLPVLKSFTRDILGQKENQTQIKGTNDYNCYLLNKVRWLDNFLHTLINGTILKSKLSDKKFWIATLPSNLQPLAKTYEFLLRKDDYENESSSDLNNKKDGGNKIKKFDLKEKEPQKEKIHEFENNIEKFSKSNLSFSAIIGNKEKATFRLGMVKNSMKVSYRPFYMPDFIDIQIESNADKKLRIRE